MEEVKSKKCKNCNCEHPLTTEFWYTAPVGKYPVCKIVLAKRAKSYRYKTGLIKYPKRIDAPNGTRYCGTCDKTHEIGEKSWRTTPTGYLVCRLKEVAIRRDKGVQPRKPFSTELKRIKNRLRSSIYLALKQNRESLTASSLLGCSVSFFKEYIESQFQPGMTWQNWNFKTWHLDHKVPLDRFNLQDQSNIQKACHYTNMQPLWAIDNLRKNRYLDEFKKEETCVIP